MSNDMDTSGGCATMGCTGLVATLGMFAIIILTMLHCWGRL